MSALTTMNKKYIYSTLKSASGSVNVIAVVKCCKKPKRTKGSGFSVFVSITDPSLEGGKLPCIFFNDSLEHLPPIQEPGDVIVMHRLVIREFRDQVQGCGFASTGFAATVFSGRVEDPLTPRPCAVKCSFYEAELARVKELRDWYNSPTCPVEREPCSLSNPPNPTVAPADASNMLDVNCSWGPVGSRCTPIQRLWSARATKFISIQGQVVSIYRQTTESDRVILYLWDGPPPENSCISDPADVLPTHSCTRFYGVPPEHLAYIDATSSHHPELVAITAHGFDETDASNPNCGVWSVPVVVYDEHVTSSTMTSLQPGDLVQINNIHVLICHQPDCPIPGCLRLIVHGGGYQFARGIHRLGPAYFLDEFSQYVELGQNLPDHLQSANEFGLLSNLREGLLRRPPALKIPGSPTVPLTMNQLCALPGLCNRIEADKFQLPMLTNEHSDPSVQIPPNSWVLLPDIQDSNTGRRTAVRVRLVARVRDACPRNVGELRDLVLLACQQCHSAVRVSCFLDPNEELCQCHKLKRIYPGNSTSGNLSVVPFVFLVLQDASRLWVVVASGPTVLNLLRIPHLSVSQLTEELIVTRSTVDTGDVTPSSRTPNVDRFLRAVHSLKYEWLDVLVRVSWRTQWDLCVPTSLDTLQMKFELLSNDASFSG